MKTDLRKESTPRKPFVEPKVERHGKLPEVTGASIPPLTSGDQSS